ncbi:MAG TPA: AMP-binding protein, partial [Paracoccaceae bacterium]|nr:AMP-binding protein [Paracoccaceae bacterium]
MEHGNSVRWFVDRHLDEGRADKPAFVQGEARLTYGDLAGRSARMAGLLARHGFGPEDRVALVALDTLDWPVMFWGCIRA